MNGGFLIQMQSAAAGKETERRAMDGEPERTGRCVHSDFVYRRWRRPVILLSSSASSDFRFTGYQHGTVITVCCICIYKTHENQQSSLPQSHNKCRQ